MKRSLFTKGLKQTMLAVPACALMLGAAHAQTTIGLNFQSWYYNSYSTPQTIGYGAGYQTTGFPVTGAAFGVPLANWFSADPMPAQASIAGYATFGGYNTTFGGGLTAYVTAPDAWESAIGEQVAGWNPETVPPGNDEVTWSYLDDGNTTGEFPTVSVSGLAAEFPNGYAVQTIAAGGGVVSFDGVDINDETTDSPVDYSLYTYFVTGTASDGVASGNGTVGLSEPSVTLTGDTLNITCNPKDAGNRSALAGFIITDVPVVTRNVPGNLLLGSGAAFTLPSPCVVGIGLTYQWQHAGTNLPGATFSTYTNNAAAPADSGLYQAVVISSYFPSISVTGQVANVSVVPTHAARTAYWDPSMSGAATDGPGTWSNTLTNWWSGSLDDYWGSADSAVFGAGGAGAYTVTLGDSITANSIAFSSGVYTITNTAGETLTLSGSPALTGTSNGVIAVPVTITTNTLLKMGVGKVTLAGSLTSTNILVGAGTLEVLAKNGDAPYVVTNGATLKIGYSTGGGYANDGIKVYGDGTSATTGLYLKGGTTYNVSGTPTLLGAPTTVRQYGSGLASMGIFDINSTGFYCTAAASGSIIDANIQMVNITYGMSAQVDAGANTATGDLVLNGPLNVDGHNGYYGFVKRGTGSLLLNAAGLPGNCQLDIRAGSAICGINNCIGTNAAIKTAAATTLDLNGTSQTVSNAVLAGTLKMTINKGGLPNCNTLNCWGQPAQYGGTLVVTNVGGPLALGDTFTLFPVVGTGAFASLVLPAVGNGLAWQDNSAVDGTIKVITGSVPPGITTDLSGGTNYAYVGGNSTFVITASGDPTLQYQWKQNGTTVVGSSPTLTLTGLTTGSAGYYSCTVTNNFGSAQSQTNYLLVVTPSMTVAASVQDAPTSFWPLNETNPSTAYDYWSGNNGTQNGSLTLGVAGPVPPTDAGFNAGTLAYQFDGASTYIDCGTNTSLSGTTDFTLEAWINTTNSNASGDILAQRSNAGYDGTANGYNGEYELTVNQNGTVSFYVFGGLAYQFSFSSPAVSRRVNDGKWHHVAAVRSGTSGIIYIDGSAVASASGTVAPLDSTIATFIGVNGRGFNNYFNGSMCDVAIYNTALSAARIGAHASTGVLGAAPLTLNIVPGGWIEDSKPSGTPHDGENLGTTWVASSTDASSVTRSGVAQFASGAQIAVPANADFNSPTGTICFWMQMPTPVNGNGTMLVDRRTSAGMVITVDGAGSGGIDIQYSGNASFAGGGYVTDGNWHHVAITYDQSASGSVSVYVDGNPTGSQANTAASSWSPSQEIELGRSHDTYWQEYNGQMDDFRIYSRVLTQAEIGTIVASDNLVDTGTLMARYNFGTAAGVGQGLVWPLGVLQSSPALSAATAWTTNNTTSATYPFLPRYSVTNSAQFYRLKL